MSLYHEASEVLRKAHDGHGSIKSIAFGQKSQKSDAKTIFALSTETAKWSRVLSEVLDESQFFKAYNHLDPFLALALVHDFLLSKRGIALPSSHGLHASIAKCKARLSAELTKARLRRGFATLNDLRASINHQWTEAANASGSRYPRWIRINTLKTSLDDELSSTFAHYERVTNLQDLMAAPLDPRPLCVDGSIPDLVAVRDFEFAKNPAYLEGKLILQDKASCFPAYLLDPRPEDGEILDACAAPGNKTTHLAALAALTAERSNRSVSRIIACEKDPARSKTLASMVQRVGAADAITVLAKQDFLRVDPKSRRFESVTALLLDPSCSGSGIVGRDEVQETICLPTTAVKTVNQHSKKRKREDDTSGVSASNIERHNSDENENMENLPTDDQKLKDRLAALAAFQLRIIEHAMSFPAARRITYSTCSVHNEENEHVVVKALLSDIALQRGWRIMTHEQQVAGMRAWSHRGDQEAIEHFIKEQDVGNMLLAKIDAVQVAEACIRCHKATDDMTMGFFLAGFVRGGSSERFDGTSKDQTNAEKALESDDEWNGFSEDDA